MPGGRSRGTHTLILPSLKIQVECFSKIQASSLETPMGKVVKVRALRGLVLVLTAVKSNMFDS